MTTVDPSSVTVALPPNRLNAEGRADTEPDPGELAEAVGEVGVALLAPPPAHIVAARAAARAPAQRSEFRAVMASL